MVTRTLGAQTGNDTAIKFILPLRRLSTKKNLQCGLHLSLNDKTRAEIAIPAQGMLHLLPTVLVELTGKIGFEMFRIHRNQTGSGEQAILFSIH